MVSKSSPCFITDFVGKKLAKSNVWEVYEPLIYLHAPSDTIIVPKGFQTDLASIPAPFRVLFSEDGSYTDAAVVHDWLYNQRHVHGRSRGECDGIFLEAMKVLGVPFYQRWPIYLGVRVGGWVFWGKK